MAVISKIQKHSYILVGLIAIALISFLFMDISGNASLISQGMNYVGKVNGEKLGYEAFDDEYKNLETSYVQMKGGQALTDVEQQSLKNQIWNNFVNEQVIGKTFEDLGIFVSAKEMIELTMGQNADENIKNVPAFKNAQGQFDPMLVANYIKSLNQDEPNTAPGTKRKQWLEFEKGIKEGRKMQKFNSLISNAMYLPSWMNEFEMSLFDKKVSMNYVYVPFTSINDKDVKITDEELKSYFDKFKNKFSSPQEIVSVNYAVFPLKASIQDSLELITKFMSRIEEMKITTNDTNFMRSYADKGYDANFYKKEDLAKYTNAEVIIAAAPKTVVGPFIDKDNFKAVKVLAKRNISDSVKVREIIISFQDAMQSQEAVAKRMKLVDSVFKALDTLNQNFEQVAATFSADKGQSTARWIYKQQNMWPADIFNDGGTKTYFKAISEKEAMVRILKVESYPASIPAVQLGEISAPFAPSSETQNAIYAQANEFKSKVTSPKSFEKNITKYTGAYTNAAYVTQNDFTIGGIEGNAREVIRWAFNSDYNEVSSLFTVGNFYIIASNNGSRNKDKVTFEMVKEDVKKMYMQEAKTKLIKEKMSLSNSLEEIASKFATTVGATDSATFLNSSFSGTAEPGIVLSAIQSKLNQVNKGIKGFNGVFAIKPTAIVKADINPSDMMNIKMSMEQSYKNTKGIVEGMIENAKVSDNRVNIF
jgi:peptidyl-prolyl cis-trans isomerase D